MTAFCRRSGSLTRKSRRKRSAWKILFEGDTAEIKNDLARYGIACEGELRGSADISGVALELADDNIKRRFVAGLADTIGSMAKSHRRFTKGFKLRVLLDQYDKFGAFAFRAKAKASSESRKLQKKTHVAKKCEAKDMRFAPSAVHPAENDPRLPKAIRGGHYIHFMHFCAAMGCDHAHAAKSRRALSASAS